MNQYLRKLTDFVEIKLISECKHLPEKTPWQTVEQISEVNNENSLKEEAKDACWIKGGNETNTESDLKVEAESELKQRSNDVNDGSKDESMNDLKKELNCETNSSDDCGNAQTADLKENELKGNFLQTIYYKFVWLTRHLIINTLFYI